MALSFNRLGGDGDFFFAAADIHADVQFGGAADADTHLRQGIGEALLADRHLVVAGRQQDEPVDTIFFGVHGLVEASLRIVGDDGGAHNHRAGGVLDRTGDLTGAGLRLGQRLGRKKAHRQDEQAKNESCHVRL